MLKQDMVDFLSLSLLSIVVYIVFIADFGICNNCPQFSAVDFCLVVTMAA
jgi:hypothetical protein